MHPPFYTPTPSANPFADPQNKTKQSLFSRRNTIREDAAFAAETSDIPPQRKLEDWAEQRQMTQNHLSRRDLIAWLSSYKQHARLPTHTLHNLGECIRMTAERQTRRNTATAYKLAKQAPEQQGPWKIWLRHDLTTENNELLSLCKHLDSNASTLHILKKNARNAIVQVTLNQQELIVKRHRADSTKGQLREGLRGSRGLKAWQAAHALEAAGIPTPTPFAALEHHDGLKVLQSFYLYENIPNAQSARSWIKPYLHQQPTHTRHKIRHHLHAMLEALYAAGIYHPDTKTGNLLIQHPENDQQRALYWIDLDGLRINAPATPYRILRNLIQLNGSLGRKLNEKERLLFLKDISTRCPTLTQSWVPRYIEKATRKRLQRERSKICGH